MCMGVRGGGMSARGSLGVQTAYWKRVAAWLLCS